MTTSQITCHGVPSSVIPVKAGIHQTAQRECSGITQKWYKVIEDEAAKTGRRVDDLAAEAIEIWLSDVHTSEREPQDHTPLFSRLADEWRRDRTCGVDVTDMVMHPSYQRIIGMGEAAIPLILNELDRRPDHWFWASSLNHRSGSRV